MPSFFARPARRPFADLIRALTEVREYAFTAASNTAHMIRQLNELKEIIVTDPNRSGQQDPNRDDQPDPARPDSPQPAEPERDGRSR